jgi:Uma2 family endonuclease
MYVETSTSGGFLMETMTQLMTAEELLVMPRRDCRYELVLGVLRVMEPAEFEHGKVTMIVASSLYQFVEENKLGIICAAETGFKISTNPDTVRAPDVAFLTNEQLERIGNPKGYWPGAPDLAVEVISPNDNYEDVMDTVLEWLDAGCRMVVTVNPRKRNVAVYRSLDDIEMLTENGILDGGDVVPGWSMPVRNIFL